MQALGLLGGIGEAGMSLTTFIELTILMKTKNSSLSLSLSLSLALLGVLLFGHARAGTMIYVAGDNLQFGTIDLQTRVYTQITASTSQLISALAADNGQLYATNFPQDSSPTLNFPGLSPTLFTLSITGVLTPIGSTGSGTIIAGLSFNASGTL